MMPGTSHTIRYETKSFIIHPSFHWKSLPQSLENSTFDFHRKYPHWINQQYYSDHILSIIHWLDTWFGIVVFRSTIPLIIFIDLLTKESLGETTRFSDLDVLVVGHGAIIRELIKYFACDLQADLGEYFYMILVLPSSTLELIDYHNRTHLITDELNLDISNKCSFWRQMWTYWLIWFLICIDYVICFFPDFSF